jgi:hypothetical protein
MTKSEEERMFSDQDFVRTVGSTGASTTKGGIKIDVVDRPSVAPVAPVERRASPEVRARILFDCLPESVRIGPHEYRIDRQSVFNGEGMLGTLDYKESAIRLKPHPTPSTLVDTLLHECVHAMWWQAGLERTGDKEPVAQMLGAGLTALFRDNPWLAGWISGAVQ